jgi:hypothetical protein
MNLHKLNNLALAIKLTLHLSTRLAHSRQFVFEPIAAASVNSHQLVRPPAHPLAGAPATNHLLAADDAAVLPVRQTAIRTSSHAAASQERETRRRKTREAHPRVDLMQVLNSGACSVGVRARIADAGIGKQRLVGEADAVSMWSGIPVPVEVLCDHSTVFDLGERKAYWNWRQRADRIVSCLRSC